MTKSVVVIWQNDDSDYGHDSYQGDEPGVIVAWFDWRTEYIDNEDDAQQWVDYLLEAIAKVPPEVWPESHKAWMKDIEEFANQNNIELDPLIIEARKVVAEDAKHAKPDRNS